MWLREWALAGMYTGEFWLILLCVFLAHLFLVADVERDRLRKRLPQKATNLYVLSLMLPIFSVFFIFSLRPFPEPFSHIVGFLVAFTAPTLIFLFAPGRYNFRKPLVWHSRVMVVFYSLLLILFSAVVPR